MCLFLVLSFTAQRGSPIDAERKQGLQGSGHQGETNILY